MNLTLLFIILGLAALTALALKLMCSVKRCHLRRHPKRPALKIAACAVMAFALFAAFCSPASAGDAKSTASSELFRSGEFDLSIGGVASIGTAQREKEAVVVGTQLGADYFVTRNLGLGARAELNDFTHSVIDRASGRLTVRAPLWDRVSPYGYAEGGYQFERERVFAGAGGGVEFRFTKGAGIYGELGLETDTRGVATGRGAAGVRIPLPF